MREMRESVGATAAGARSRLRRHHKELPPQGAVAVAAESCLRRRRAGGYRQLSPETKNTFATLSPIPGYMPWLLSKLASQLKLAKSEPEDMIHVPQSGSISAFREDILSPEEEIMILESAGEQNARKSGLEVMHYILTSANIEWTKSERVAAALEPPLMRLCARYLVKEKKRRKALDPVANFHLQNGAMVERINWMADQSGKGIHQSAGIMVNYVYRLEKIEEYAQLYLSTGHIHTSSNFDKYHDGAEAV